MTKIAFKNDYSEGCHSDILQALMHSNSSQQNGYGLDNYSTEAKQLIGQHLNNSASKIYFVSGGTQANLLVISAALRPHESAISAETGHIFSNETGAIEATGHKIHSIATQDGKITPDGIQAVLDKHPLQPHQLKPKLVFISNATELGSIYTKQELQALSQYCHAHNLYLYMDGARLAQALAAKNNDVTLADIAQLIDVFYIGGTKNGALLGEAIVMNNPLLQSDFEYHIKQKGAMLAKGRLLGLQFQTLFSNSNHSNPLFFELATHANEQAQKIKSAFAKIGCSFLSNSSTNQIFPILKNSQIEVLSQQFDFYIWQKIDEEHSAVRIITSWATSNTDVEAFVAEIAQQT